MTQTSNPNNRPPVCNYEGSDYQQSFWEQSDRAYEDQVEAIALQRLLPDHGRLLLELGAGAGRNTPRYQGFERVVLLDYSRSQLEQAQQKLGINHRYTYVAADVYRLPFASGVFDAATMIRTLHHMADAPLALAQVRRVLQPGAIFILEYANKQNLKAIFRYLLRRQDWSPFDRQPVEFARLNFDFHPQAVRHWLTDQNFSIERQLTVSHYRMALLKRLLPLKVLVAADAAAQLSGNWWQLTPSVFVRARASGQTPPPAEPAALFSCPECGHAPLEEQPGALACPACQLRWEFRDGIYDFRAPL
jgi:ubiquinone/menaquinone biosynthesis C-methylase UbiE